MQQSINITLIWLKYQIEKEKIKRNFYEIMKLSYTFLKGYLTRQLRIIGICLYMYMLIIYDLFLKLYR